MEMPSGTASFSEDVLSNSPNWPTCGSEARHRIPGSTFQSRALASTSTLGDSRCLTKDIVGSSLFNGDYTGDSKARYFEVIPSDHNLGQGYFRRYHCEPETNLKAESHRDIQGSWTRTHFSSSTFNIQRLSTE